MALQHVPDRRPGRRRGRLRGRRRPGRAAARARRRQGPDHHPHPPHPSPPRPRGRAGRPDRALPRRGGDGPRRRAHPGRQRDPAAGRARPGRRARRRGAADPRPHQGHAQLPRGQRRVHRRHAVQGLGRRRARARPHDLRRPARVDHGPPDGAAARHRPPARAHRRDDGGRGVGAQRVHPRLARPRPRGRRALHGAGRAGDARPARRPTTTAARRPGCAGRTARDDIVPGSQVAALGGRTDWPPGRAHERAKDKIPTSRVRRTAKVGALAAGQAAQAAGHAARPTSPAPTRRPTRRWRSASSRPPSRSSRCWGR